MLTMISRSAEISLCKNYRYLLTRTQLLGHGRVTFVMLNPSTADGLKDDATIRRCLGFMEDWGYRELCVVNLFAWRATYPKDMLKQMDPVGPFTDEWILRATEGDTPVVCAWGAHTHRVVRARGEAVKGLLEQNNRRLFHLGMSQEGCPRHPLFIERTTELTRWI